MYELIILSLLMRFSLHGYLIAKIANGTIGPWAKISNGTLYPLLNRLEQTGLIERTSGGGEGAKSEQTARTYTITPAGRERFYHLMRDTSTNIGDYQKLFNIKVSYMDLLPTSERKYLLNQYIHYCQACILHLRSEADDLTHQLADRPQHELYKTLALKAMQHRADIWQAEVDWTRQLWEELTGEKPPQLL